MNEKELSERSDVLLENYIITVEVEARCMLEMVKRQIMPVVKTADLEADSGLEDLIAASKSLQEKVDDMHDIEEFADQAKVARDLRLGTMVEIRALCDRLEAMVPAG